MTNEPTMAEKPKRTTNAELAQEIAALKADLKRLMGRTESRAEPEEMIYTVLHGSDEHAAHLGLRKATEEDGDYVIEGWTLDDITNYPPSVTPVYIKRILRQKVNNLISPVPVMQSRDPREPHYAPPMWDPSTSRPFRQITE